MMWEWWLQPAPNVGALSMEAIDEEDEALPRSKSVSFAMETSKETSNRSLSVRPLSALDISAIYST